MAENQLLSTLCKQSLIKDMIMYVTNSWFKTFPKHRKCFYNLIVIQKLSKSSFLR